MLTDFYSDNPSPAGRHPLSSASPCSGSIDPCAADRCVAMQLETAAVWNRSRFVFDLIDSPPAPRLLSHSTTTRVDADAMFVSAKNGFLCVHSTIVCHIPIHAALATEETRRCPDNRNRKDAHAQPTTVMAACIVGNRICATERNTGWCVSVFV